MHLNIWNEKGHHNFKMKKAISSQVSPLTGEQFQTCRHVLFGLSQGNISLEKTVDKDALKLIPVLQGQKWKFY